MAVQNILALIRGKAPHARYNGYTACPVVTDYGKVMLAEFDYENKPCETFPFDLSLAQKHARRALRQLTQDCENVMADPSSKTSNVGPTLWAVLFLACIGLVLAHLYTAVQTEVKPETNLIDRTFVSLESRR